MRKLDGAFSVVALSEGKLVAFRDPRGMRPLCIGRLDGDWVVASESCALDLVGAEFEREIRPGELLVVDEELESHQAVPLDGGGGTAVRALCYRSGSCVTVIRRPCASASSRAAFRSGIPGPVLAAPHLRLSQPAGFVSAA